MNHMSYCIVFVVLTALSIAQSRLVNFEEKSTSSPLSMFALRYSWSYWSRWSSCSTTCGSGTRRRFRSCRSCKTSDTGLVQYRKYSFRKCYGCFGRSSETLECSLGSCSIASGALTTAEIEKAFSIKQPEIDPGSIIQCFTDEDDAENLNSLSSNHKMVKRSGDGNGLKWPKGEVLYFLADSLTENDRLVFARAINEIQLRTCVKFFQANTNVLFFPVLYLYVRRKCDCTDQNCDPIGYTDGIGASSPRTLTIERVCLNPSSLSHLSFMMHEIFHALGVIHTQKRPDRDDYITVNWDNIEDSNSATHQYSKCSSCSTLGVQYECDSIMHYFPSFYSNGGGPTMTAKDPSTCSSIGGNTGLKRGDVEMIKRMYQCTGGANIYLRIRGVDDGNQCMAGFMLPGDSSFKTGSLVDLTKLLNNPYGGTSKYWMKFGGYGVAASTPFTGCIDDNNQEYVEVTDDNTAILKFSGIQVPGWYGSGSWGTTIWIQVMSQCHNVGSCSPGKGHWWKFEKVLDAEQAENFAFTHANPSTASDVIVGEPVVLQYMGETSCDATATYGCDPGELN